MQERKELFGMFLAAATNTLQELIENESSYDLTKNDIPGVLGDMFAYSRIYLALLNEDLSVLNQDELAIMNKLEAYAFTHPIPKFTS
jgi:hypothetical protein